MDEQGFENSPIIEQLEDQIAREKSSVRNPLHIWWARLPSVIARTAVFANLGPQSEDSAQLLDEIGRHPVSDETIERATRSLEDAFRVSRDEGSLQRQPRLLDPFSGSGSIPLAAGRMGVEAHAVDINPVAYILQLCRLTFPQRFGKPDPRFRGIERNSRWAGLAAEVKYWSEWVDEQVLGEVGWLYPSLDGKDDTDSPRTPQAYFWSHTTECENLSCGVNFPLISYPYLVKKPGQTLALQPTLSNDDKTVAVTITEQLDKSAIKTLQRGRATCPICGTQQVLSADNIREPRLIAVLSASNTGKWYSAEIQQGDIQPEIGSVDQGIEALHQDTGIQPLVEELPPIFTTQRYGLDTYNAIFTRRQLLFLLTLVKYIPIAHGSMLSQRYEPERATAVATYLGLFLSNLVNYHNKLCRWQAVREQPQPIFMYLKPAMTWTYVEINPFASTKSLRAHAERLSSTIERNSRIESSVHVRCVSATSLPYPDECFDGIVTAAPYYDAIPYGDLSHLYFVWLKRSIGHLYPREFRSELMLKTDEIVVVRESDDTTDDQRGIAEYREKLSRALVEVERVLKPGRFFTMIVPTSKADVLQDFLELTQAAGLDLVDVKRIRTSRATIRNRAASYQALLTFRKSKLVQQTSQALVDAAAVLRLADKDEPVLCSGLAQLLIDYLETDDLEYLIPDGYQGSLTTRCIEYVNNCENPRDLLDELGIATLRRIVRERDLSGESEDPKDVILKAFGFNVPEPEQTGVDALLRDLPKSISKARLASSPDELRGIFATTVTQFESILKRAVWAWGEIVFGVDRDARLHELAGKDLNRLSLGDYQRLFLGLPEHVVDQGFGERAEQLLYRSHLYSTRKLAPRLDSVVAFRNRVEHNKEEYLTLTSMERVRSDVEATLQTIHEVLEDLKQRAALPLIARPVRKTIDVFGRCSYELKIEDGTVREVYVTNDLVLGRDYYFFTIESNPRPVDPPMIPVSLVLAFVP